MQSFLGAALLFKSPVGEFSDNSVNLYKMTQKNFIWDRSTWGIDYEEEFKNMKSALSNSVANHFPNYELDWTLRIVASKVAVGAVLYQTRKGTDGTVTHEAIGFASRKFSNVALRLHTMKKVRTLASSASSISHTTCVASRSFWRPIIGTFSG